MLNSKQLYQSNMFVLPQITALSLDPFPKYDQIIIEDESRNHAIDTIFLSKSPEFKSFCSAYSTYFEQLCAKQNLYPFMIDTGPTKLTVVCKECLIVCDCEINEKGKLYEGGDEIIKISKSDRTKLIEIPTTLRAGRFSVFVGLQTGRISQYNYKTKSWEGVSDELQFPVMQIEIVRQQQNKQTSIIASDSAGNITFITFSHKTFMDKIIKTLTTAKWISFAFRNKKREKIKKLFKNLISSKEKQSETSGTEPLAETFPYTYTRFHLSQINEDSILAINRKNQVEVLVLDNQYEVKKNIQLGIEQEQKDNEVAFIQIGKGSFQQSNTRHNILVFGINRSILFYRIIDIQESYEIVKIKEIEVQEKMLFGKFISNNLLMIGDKSGLKLTNIGDKPSPSIAFDLQKFSYVSFFIDEEGLDMDKKLQNYNLLSLLGQKQQIDSKMDSRFICLQGKRLITGKVFGWQSILYRFIQEQNWQEALKYYLNIYNGTFKLCCSVNEDIAKRNLQMSSICQVIVMGYLRKNLIILRAGNIQTNYLINNVIYFLLKCQQSHILFYEIQQFLSVSNATNMFIDQLSNYVEQSNSYNLKIPFISEKILTLIIKKYKQGKQDHVLQRLFMQFDLNQMEKLMLLTTCLRQELYQSLIYICCEQKDYITPIIKLCGIKISNPQKHERISEITFWYLSECLMGRMTDYGNEADYINMLAILINFMFIPSSLEMLLQTSHHYLIKVVNMFFEPRIMRYVLQNEQKFFMRKGEVGEPIFEQSSLKEYKLYQKMLSTLIKVIQNSQLSEKEKYQLELNKFLTSLMVKNHLPFLSSMKIRIILFYISHPFIFIDSLSDEITEQNQIFMNGHLMRLLDSQIRSINQKCLYVRQKIKVDQSIKDIQQLIVKQKQAELSKILSAIMISHYNMQFSQTKCYIYHELGNYSQVLEIYLKMTNKKLRQKIYQYLQNNINEYEQLTQQFFKYMISLLRIDEARTIKIIWNLKQNWINNEEVIDKLIDYPAIQLQYIEKVISNGNQKSKKLLLRHLEIVLRERPDQIQNFINKIDYPLEEAFIMCEERNNKKGKAFILIKSGRNMEGVLIITQIFLEAIQQYLRGLFKKLEFDEERKETILKQFRVVLQTCNKEWTIDNDRGQQIWQRITEIIFKKLNINNIDSQHIPQSIRDILNEIVTQLLATMLEQVSTDFFLNRFAKTFGSLPFRIFMQAYKYIFQRIQFTFTMQKLNKDLLQSQQYQTWEQIIRSVYHGHVCNLVCNICNNLITINERMVSYDCGHIYHQECYCQQNNKKNKNQLCPLCFNSIDNYLIVGDNKLPRYRLQVDEKELLKHKISRMNYYDRASIIAAMENWSKFQQWVDI